MKHVSQLEKVPNVTILLELSVGLGECNKLSFYCQNPTLLQLNAALWIVITRPQLDIKATQNLAIICVPKIIRFWAIFDPPKKSETPIFFLFLPQNGSWAVSYDANPILGVVKPEDIRPSGHKINELGPFKILLFKPAPPHSQPYSILGSMGSDIARGGHFWYIFQVEN